MVDIDTSESWCSDCDSGVSNIAKNAITLPCSIKSTVQTSNHGSFALDDTVKQIQTDDNHNVAHQ